MSDRKFRQAQLSQAKHNLLQQRLQGVNPMNSKSETIRPRFGSDCLLSFAQERLWIIDQLESGRSVYSIFSARYLQGRLDVHALERSLNEIVRRHEVLRTHFVARDGRPLQIIAPTLTIPLPVVHIRGPSLKEQQLEVKRLLKDEFRQPFDLSQGPLFRVSLLKLGEEDHVMVSVMHHIISDGWSEGIFNREVMALYEAYAAGRPSPLSNLPIQYADYAMWQREWLRGDVLEKQLNYWKQQLADIPVLLELPIAKHRPPELSYEGGEVQFVLPLELSEKLKELGQREGCTLYMTLLAAFDVLLYRYTSQEDIVVGAPIAGRTRPELEGLIGFFVNTLVMRTRLSATMNFRALIQQVKDTALSAYDHQDLPFEKLVEELRPERALNHNPLFQIAFILQNTSRHPLKLSGINIHSWPVENHTSKFDLSLNMWETNNWLAGTIEYSTDLFEKDAIERMAGHWQVLLEGIVADPECRIAELAILTQQERHKILMEWNETRVDYPHEKCIHQLFEEQVERTPDAVAVVFENQQLTYRELNQRSNQLAHYLQKLGIGPEVLVGICVERSLEMIVGILGILKAGGAYVPFDLAYPKERLQFMIQDSAVALVLTQQHLLPELPLGETKIICLDREEDTRSRASFPDYNPPCQTIWDNLAYVIYTSGSTGTPKGVMSTHGNMARLFYSTESWFHFGENDVWTLFHSYAFDFSVWEIWGALIYGGRLVIVSYLISRSPSDFFRLVCKEGVTVLCQTPSAFYQFADAADPRIRPRELVLRYVIFGGEALNFQRLKTWFEWYGDKRPELINMYGITETTVHVTYRPLTIEDVNLSGGSRIGCPIPDLQIYLLDPNQQLAPVGLPGEIYVGGAGLARGYLNRPELTQKRFIPNPFRDRTGGRLYRTGDLACFRSGHDLEYLGRIDDQVKVRGYRIELGEIETILVKYPGITSAVALLQENQQDDKRLVAYFIANDSYAASSTELRQYLRKHLPTYMVPSQIVRLDTFPLTNNGKVDRKALSAVDVSLLEQGQWSIPPETPVELALAEIWMNLIRLERIGIDDNFFDIGGHSLLAVELITRVKQSFNKGIPLSEFFRNATIRQMADSLQRNEPMINQLPIVKIKRGEAKPAFFCVPPAGGNSSCYTKLADYLNLEQPFYGLQALGLDGKQAPSNRIEEIAASYIAAIRSIQQDGPYLLCGWSMGGVVAFEMARQLKQQRCEIVFLALIDSGAPLPGYYALIEDEVQMLVSFFNDLSVNLSGCSTISSEELYSLAPSERIQFVVDRAHRERALPLSITAHEIERFFDVYTANQRALSCYSPRSFSQNITLFRAIDHQLKGSDSTLGWNQLANGKIDVDWVPGNHYTIMLEPHVQLLAEKFRPSILTVLRKLQ